MALEAVIDAEKEDEDKLLLGFNLPAMKAAATFERSHKVMALTDLERELIIRFVLKDERVVFGGSPPSGPPEKK